MREILFRGKRKENPEWIEGFYVQHGEKSYIYTGNRECVVLPIYVEKGIKYEVIPETVCQYTGLTDKNGRKIFEGDILKIPYEHLEDSICKVVFNHGMFIGELVDGCEESIQRRKEDMEVIGNIFDNPELIGDKP